MAVGHVSASRQAVNALHPVPESAVHRLIDFLGLSSRFPWPNQMNLQAMPVPPPVDLRPSRLGRQDRPPMKDTGGDAGPIPEGKPLGTSHRLHTAQR